MVTLKLLRRSYKVKLSYSLPITFELLPNINLVLTNMPYLNFSGKFEVDALLCGTPCSIYGAQDGIFESIICTPMCHLPSYIPINLQYESHGTVSKFGWGT